jgi:hypothetical protein
MKKFGITVDFVDIDASEEEIPIIVCVKLRENVEVLDRHGIFSVRQRPSTSHEERVPVILGGHILHTGKRQSEYYQ